MSELLPCPFCGSKPEKHKYMDRCACSRDTCWLYGRFMSIDDWNTRTTRTTPAPSISESELINNLATHLREKFYGIPDSSYTLKAECVEAIAYLQSIGVLTGMKGE